MIRWTRKPRWSQPLNSSPWFFTTVTPTPRSTSEGEDNSWITARSFYKLFLFFQLLYTSILTTCIVSRFLNPQLVTKVSPSDDIEGINNFDIFVIQVFLYLTKNFFPGRLSMHLFYWKGCWQKKLIWIITPQLQEGPKPGAETEGVIMDYDRWTLFSKR